MLNFSNCPEPCYVDLNFELHARLRNRTSSEQFLADLNVNDNKPMEETIASNASLVTDIATVPPPDWDSQFDPSRGVDSYKSFTDHPVLIHHLTWNAALSGSQTLTQNLIRRYFTVAPPAIKNRLNTFYFVRADIKLTFVVQGAAQCAGMMSFTAYPLPKSGLNDIFAYTNHNNDVNARINPHVLIDPSKSESMELILPMCTTTGYYDVSSSSAGTDTNGSYELVRRVYLPLISGTSNSADISVCVYMSLVNPVFVGLRQVIGLAPLMSEKKPSGSLSSIAYGVSKVANTVGTVFPSLGPTASIFSALSGAAGAALQFLGFAKPQAVENLNVVMNRQADNWTQVDGVSNAVVLGRSQGQTVSISPGYIGGSLEEMSTSHIASIPGKFADFAINPTVPTQTLVTSFFVHPAIAANVTSRTPLRGLADAHAMWSGDLTMTFEFVASVFHRCTVLIAWAPDQVVPSFVNALNTLKNTTVYISGNTSVSITIPWTQTQPALSCDNNAGSRNGMIHLFVINPLQSNGSTDPIYCNCMIHSDNIAFLMPSKANLGAASEFLSYAQDSINFTPTVVVPLGPPIDWTPCVPVSFGPATNVAHIGSAITGDRVVSIKDVVSRMEPTMAVPVQGPWDTLTVRPYPMTTGPQAIIGFFAHYSQAFLGSRGSYRVTLASDKGFTTVWATYLPSPFLAAAETVWQSIGWPTFIAKKYAMTAFNLRVAAGMDVVCPMTIATNFYPNRNCGMAGSGFSVHNQGYVGNLSFGGFQPGTNPQVIKGAGDDFIMSGFIGFPKLVTPAAGLESGDDV